MGKIFISYRRKDSDFTHRIAEKLHKQQRLAEHLHSSLAHVISDG